MSKIEGKTNFSRRLKQFDLTDPTSLILQQINASGYFRTDFITVRQRCRECGDRRLSMTCFRCWTGCRNRRCGASHPRCRHCRRCRHVETSSSFPPVQVSHFALITFSLSLTCFPVVQCKLCALQSALLVISVFILLLCYITSPTNSGCISASDGIYVCDCFRLNRS